MQKSIIAASCVLVAFTALNSTATAGQISPSIFRCDLETNEWSEYRLYGPGTPHFGNASLGACIDNGDVDGDALSDLISVSSLSSSVHHLSVHSPFDGTYRGTPLDLPSVHSPLSSVSSVAVGQISYDGLTLSVLDQVLVGACDGEPGFVSSFSWGATQPGQMGLAPSGSPPFAPFGETYTGGLDLAIGDLDRDGMPDLAMSAKKKSYELSGHVTLMKRFGNTSGGFTFEPFDSLPTEVGVSIAVGDVDGDGFDDLACLTTDDTGTKVLRVFSVEETPDGTSVTRVLDWSWGASNSGTMSQGAGSGVGKASFQDLHFWPRPNNSALLFLSANDGSGPVVTCLEFGEDPGTGMLSVIDEVPISFPSLDFFPDDVASQWSNLGFALSHTLDDAPGILPSSGSMLFSPVLVPEPASLGLVGLTGLIFLSRRRR